MPETAEVDDSDVAVLMRWMNRRDEDDYLIAMYETAHRLEPAIVSHEAVEMLKRRRAHLHGSIAELRGQIARAEAL